MIHPTFSFSSPLLSSPLLCFTFSSKTSSSFSYMIYLPTKDVVKSERAAYSQSHVRVSNASKDRAKPDKVRLPSVPYLRLVMIIISAQSVLELSKSLTGFKKSLPLVSFLTSPVCICVLSISSSKINHRRFTLALTLTLTLILPTSRPPPFFRIPLTVQRLGH